MSGHNQISPPFLAKSMIACAARFVFSFQWCVKLTGTNTLCSVVIFCSCLSDAECVAFKFYDKNCQLIFQYGSMGSDVVSSGSKLYSKGINISCINLQIQIACNVRYCILSKSSTTFDDCSGVAMVTSTSTGAAPEVTTDTTVPPTTSDITSTATAESTPVFSSTAPWPAAVPVPYFYEDFEDLTDMELFNSPHQAVGKVSKKYKLIADADLNSGW